MEILKYCGIAVTVIGAAAVFISALKGGRGLKKLLINAFFGVGFTALINLTAKFTGIYIPINQWTVAGTACFGVPAVCGFLVLPLIFG